MPMPKSPEREIPPPTGSRQQKLAAKRQKRVIPNKFAGLAAFLILVIGLVNFASVSALQAFAFNAEQPAVSQTEAGFAGRVDDPYPLPEITVTPTIEAHFSFRPPATPEPAAPAINPAPVVVEAPVAETEPVTAPVATGPLAGQPIQHVIIISVDGMRPDAMELAVTPNIDKLMATGAYSRSAQTVCNSITLISHASMLSGVLPEKHGIVWGVPYIGWPGMASPTLFNLAHEAGLSTGMAFGKNKLNYLVFNNSVDHLFGEDAHDPDVRDHALEIIEEGLPNVLFVHLPDTDRVGHAYGWMSENQLYAIQYADGIIGEIVTALEENNYMDTTLIIITADHGGHGFTHGDDNPEDRTIPWLAAGPGVPQGVILSSPISTMDTAATTLHALGLSIPDYWVGKPVLEIFQ